MGEKSEQKTIEQQKEGAAQETVVAKSGVSFKLIALIVLLNIAVTVAVVVGYDHFFAQKIYVLDTQEYARNQRALYIDGKISEKDFMESVDRLKAAINGLKPNQVLFINNDKAVIKNGKVFEP